MSVIAGLRKIEVEVFASFGQLLLLLLLGLVRSKKLAALLAPHADRYGVAVLDLSDPQAVDCFAHHPEREQNRALHAGRQAAHSGRRQHGDGHRARALPAAPGAGAPRRPLVESRARAAPLHGRPAGPLDWASRRKIAVSPPADSTGIQSSSGWVDLWEIADALRGSSVDAAEDEHVVLGSSASSSRTYPMHLVSAIPDLARAVDDPVDDDYPHP